MSSIKIEEKVEPIVETKKESLIKGKTYVEESIDRSLWFKKFDEKRKLEAATGPLLGNITDEVAQKSPSVETYNQVVTGIEKLGSLEFTHRYTTVQPTFIIPKLTIGDVGAISGGVTPSGSSIVTGATVNLNAEYGHTVTWTRAYLEDAGYPVMAEQNAATGKSIKYFQIQKCIDLLTGGAVAGFSTGAAGAGVTWVSSGSVGITFTDFKNVCSKVDLAGYGPVNTVICSPSIYWQLLDLEELTSALYNGGPEVMNSGVLKTTFGVDIIKCDTLRIPTGAVVGQFQRDYIIAMNRDKALAFVERRGLQIDPFERPETNNYGYVASCRFAVAPIWTGAAGIGIQQA
jgi:hypothetical protein